MFGMHSMIAMACSNTDRGRGRLLYSAIAPAIIREADAMAGF